ncbi:MAG: hypothetical protein NZO58_14620, partial [Gemmataceae bacterium]|nr:hypothetical protein [Gemmataceae bacterium]
IELLDDLLWRRINGNLLHLVTLVTAGIAFAFISTLLTGVLSMLSDVFHKVYYRQASGHLFDEPPEPIDISLRGRRRPRWDE